MQVSGTKTKTDWEKIQDIKTTKQILIKNNTSNLSSLTQPNLPNIDKNHSNIYKVSNCYEFFQPQKIQSFEIYFGISSEWQKQWFDSLGLNQNVLSEFGQLCDTVMKETRLTFDAYARFAQIQSDMLTDSIQMSKNILEQGLDWYSKIMSSFITKK